jgi:endoglucanase
MRQLPLFFLLIPSIASALPCRAETALVGSAAAATASSYPTTPWTNGLRTGVNGPVPTIVVDQFGYPTWAQKVAVIRNPQVGYDGADHFTPGKTYALVAKATGQMVKKGTPVPWNGGATDGISGDRAWWFDFSDVKQPGTYVVLDTDTGLHSGEFDISDSVYRNVLQAAVRMFYYQRAGFAKTAATAGAAWADGASHLGAGQDPQTHPWPGINETAIKDLHGGWFDAGDYNKYTSWAARNIIVLLRAYGENPAVFGDNTGIAESDNGVPDILDEVKWGVDWLVRMQTSQGSLLCVQGLDGASPPSAAAGPSFYGPPTTAASLMGAAAYAYASKIYSTRPEAEFKTYGAMLLSRAQKAWAWAVANPSVKYYNNDNSLQPGSGGLAAGQQEMSDADRLFAKFEAAVYLYELTGEATYKGFVEANYTSIVASWGPTQWDGNRQEALIYYTRLPGVSADVKSAIVNHFVTNMQGNSDQLPMVVNNRDPYRAPMKDYTWGSNLSKMTQGRLYELLAMQDVSSDVTSKADLAAVGFLNYLHGVNPLGLVYLTNLQAIGAENSANTIYHTWFAAGTRWSKVTGITPGPAPGYLAGGPNPGYSLDVCCTAAAGTAGFRCYGSTAFSLCSINVVPPVGQPLMKSYLQFNDGWPADSWAVTEPSTNYQAQYIRTLSRYVH